MFRRACNWSISSARLIQHILSHPISLISILTLFSYLHGLYLSGSPTKTLHAFLFSPFYVYFMFTINVSDKE
jgi:hypothetical protein